MTDLTYADEGGRSEGQNQIVARYRGVAICRDLDDGGFYAFRGDECVADAMSLETAKAQIDGTWNVGGRSPDDMARAEGFTFWD